MQYIYGKYPWQGGSLPSLWNRIAGIHRRGGGADDSFWNHFDFSWDTGFADVLWKFVNRVACLSRQEKQAQIKMPILSANRIGGVRKDSKYLLGASTLEWVLSFCIIIIAFFSSYFKWCWIITYYNIWRKIWNGIECREKHKLEFVKVLIWRNWKNIKLVQHYFM